jgi:serine/threonine protein kinase
MCLCLWPPAHACRRLAPHDDIACTAITRLISPPLTQLFDAMDYIHNERNIIHCDIKPENILLSHGLLPTPGSTSAMGECLPPAPVVAVPAGAIFATQTCIGATCPLGACTTHGSVVVTSTLSVVMAIPSGFLVVFEKPNRSSFTFTFSPLGWSSREHGSS